MRTLKRRRTRARQRQLSSTLIPHDLPQATRTPRQFCLITILCLLFLFSPLPLILTGWDVSESCLVLISQEKSETIFDKTRVLLCKRLFGSGQDLIIRAQSTAIFLCIQPFSAWWRTITTNRVILEQACSWPVRRQSFAIIVVTRWIMTSVSLLKAQPSPLLTMLRSWTFSPSSICKHYNYGSMVDGHVQQWKCNDIQEFQYSHKIDF